MKRIILILAVSLAILPLLNSSAFGRTLTDIGPVVTRDHGLSIDLWTDRSQDEVYDVGDDLEVYFRANSDCYVTIYNIDTEGRVEVLFPRFPDDGYVFGGMTHRLPDYYDAMDLRLRGPDGIGYLHAVGSYTPRAFQYSIHNNHYHLNVDPIAGDPYIAINAINDRLIDRRYLNATATSSFFVGSRAWYPRYLCYDCHGRSARFNPYTDACPRYNVQLTRDYDYWWGYDYHPATIHFSFGGPFWRFDLRTIPAHRHRSLRYIDCAYGYGNYYPIRPIHRPARIVVYNSPKHKTRRSYARNYKPVTFKDTRIRRTGNTRTRDRATESSGSTRSRSTGTSASQNSSSSRTRSTGTTTSPSSTSSRTRSTGTTTSPSSTSSRSRATGTTTSPSSTSSRTRSTETTTRPSSTSSRTRSTGTTTSPSSTSSRSRATGTTTRPSSSSSRSAAITQPADGTAHSPSTRQRTATKPSTQFSTPSSSSNRTRSSASQAPRATSQKTTRSTPSSSSRGTARSSGRSSNDEKSTTRSR